MDEFDAIYREAVPPGQKSAKTPPRPAPTDAAWKETITLTSPLVFRYSAVTWNAHRIHYDADYTRDEEGYPGTVQNGGLTMQLLTDAALSHADGQLKSFTTRLTRPIYVGDTVSLCGGEMTDGAHGVLGGRRRGESLRPAGGAVRLITEHSVRPRVRRPECQPTARRG